MYCMPIVTAGASGGVYSLIAAHLATMYCMPIVIAGASGGVYRLIAAHLATVYCTSLVTAGASGGVYSLIAAHLATMALNWQEDSSVRIQKVHQKYWQRFVQLN